MAERIHFAPTNERPRGKVEFVPHGVTISMYVGETHVGDIDLDESPTRADTDLLSDFEILPQYQGNGYGTMLVKEALSRSTARYQEAWVAKSNKASLAVFQACGFKKTGGRDGNLLHLRRGK